MLGRRTVGATTTSFQRVAVPSFAKPTQRLLQTQSTANAPSAAASSATTAEYLNVDALAAKKNLESGNLAEAYGFSKEAGAFGDSGLLNKYGPWTVGGLALASAISKEWIILGEETPVLLTFMGVVFAGYVSFRDSVSSAVNTEMDRQFSFHEEVIDNAISAAQKTVTTIEAQRQLPELFQQAWGSFQNLMHDYGVALTRKAQINLNHTFEERLEGLIKLEQRFKDQKTEDMRASVGRYLKEKIRAKPQAFRDNLVNDALSSLLLLNVNNYRKAKKVDVAKAVALAPVNAAAKAVNLNLSKPQEVEGLIGKAVERSLSIQKDVPVENPQIKSMFNEFINDWNAKSGKPVVRTLTDAEYKKLLDDAEKAHNAELETFDKKQKAFRDALQANPPTLLQGDQLKQYMAELEARSLQEREVILASKKVPSRQVTEFRPFYSK